QQPGRATSYRATTEAALASTTTWDFWCRVTPSAPILPARWLLGMLVMEYRSLSRSTTTRPLEARLFKPAPSSRATRETRYRWLSPPATWLKETTSAPTPPELKLWGTRPTGSKSLIDLSSTQWAVRWLVPATSSLGTVKMASSS